MKNAELLAELKPILILAPKNAYVTVLLIQAQTTNFQEVLFPAYIKVRYSPFPTTF